MGVVYACYVPMVTAPCGEHRKRPSSITNQRVDAQQVIALGVMNTAITTAASRLAQKEQLGGFYGVMESVENVAGSHPHSHSHSHTLSHTTHSHIHTHR